MPSGPHITKSMLDTSLDSALAALNGYSPTTKEYEKTLETVRALHKMKQEDKLPRVSPDTIAIVFGNLLGIVMILKHERADIVTSKALGFVMKIR